MIPVSHSFHQERNRIFTLNHPAALSEILCDDTQETALRLLAAQKLGTLGVAGRDTLQAAYSITAEDPPGRIAVIKALVSAFLTDAKPTLLDALHDPWPRVRRSARLLLKDNFDALDVHFRLRCYLPKHLYTDERAAMGNWTGFSRDDQISILHAIRLAHFSPALPPLVTALHEQCQIPVSGLSKWYSNEPVRLALSCAVVAFGNEAIPHLLRAISGSTQDRYSVFSALAQINTPESWSALERFQPTYAVRKLMESRQNKTEDEQTKPAHSRQVPSPKSRIPLSASDFSDYTYSLFDSNRNRVRTAIEQLQKEVSEEAIQLITLLANDTTSPRRYRQWAHNGAEMWRRYNG
jgi:hypothetical protein